MKRILILFPNQLFNSIKDLKNYYGIDDIIIIEDTHFYDEFKYHKIKIMYHKSTILNYVNGTKTKVLTNCEFEKTFNKKNVFLMFQPFNHQLEQKYKKMLENKLYILKSLNFLLTKSEIKNEVKNVLEKSKYRHDVFYTYMRKKYNILLTKNEKPQGGKWSYDKENRKKVPKGKKIPKNKKINFSDKQIKILECAKKWTLKHYKNNYGELPDNVKDFPYPIDRKQSIQWLKDFIKRKFKDFGDYQDYVMKDEPFMWHSIITPMLNIGLIVDKDVIDEFEKVSAKSVSLASREGFIRQVIGWRNYVLSMYVLFGNKMKNENFFNAKKKLNMKKWWEGTTNILPLDNAIEKIKSTGYVHHIERLMYLGSFMLMLGVNPKDVYKIFMEWTIDAYEWVMIPNVFGMALYADGGRMMTRPYFSSSSYVKRMSNYGPGNWEEDWNAVYYDFISQHKNYLKKNYASARQVRHWENKSKSEKTKLVNHAKKVKNRLLK